MLLSEMNPLYLLQLWANYVFESINYQSLTITLGLLIAIVIIYNSMPIFKKIRMKDSHEMSSTRPRFRKRDKVMFYGRKMLRKVRMIGRENGKLRIKKRQMVLRLAKRLLKFKRDQPLTLQVMEPSQAFLEEAIADSSDPRLPPEVMYMLQSIRVFGIFEKPLFLELCKFVETSQICCGSMLFSIGVPDDSIYIVQNGKIVVYVTETDGSELILKEVGPGESIASLLSVMDVLTGHTAPYKTVSARALEDSCILRLKVEAFRSILEKNPESLVRVAQIIMVRLQRVTFTALHHYLGLTNQLIKPSSANSKKVSTISPKPSPSRKTSRRQSQSAYIRSFINEPPLTENLPDSVGINTRNTEDSVTSPTEELDKVMKSFPTFDRPVFKPYHKGLRIAPDGQEAFKPRKRKASFYLPSDSLMKNTEEDMKLQAVKGFAHHLGLDDEDVLSNYVTVKEFSANTHIILEENVEDVALFYVIVGSLSVSQKTVDKKEESVLFVVHNGEIMGALAVLSGEPSLFTVKTRHFSRVGMLSKKHAYEILRMKPLAVLHLAQSVIKRLSPFVRQIDFALDWINIESGRAIFRQGDASDSTYILLSGRLRSVLSRCDGKKELVGEYGRGDLVGIVEVLTSTPRSTTVMAVRNSELAKLPEGLLNAIKIKYPEVVTRFVHLLGHRLLVTLEKGEKAVMMDSRPTGSNFSTVAILPTTDEVPLLAFTMELYHALTVIGPTLTLTSDVIKKSLGPTALTSANEYRLCSWLGQQEDQHKIVLYQCDSYFTVWTQRCMRQADCIIILALVDDEPCVGRLEKELENYAVRTQKELVLLHRDDGIKPRNTVEWLNMRSWCSSHYHIRCPKRMFTKRSPASMMQMYEKIFEAPPSIYSDFARLARFLTGTSIGLVLGGGGARGAAHVGMIRALAGAGIPIDMVGGVSIGAFMGALWCQENDLTTFTQKAREWSLKMNSYWRQILDLTYPATAMFTGAAFNRTIHEVFGERQIEDLWLPYFTVTTDITASQMRVHTHGSLWRYIRSSMSLSGYMPPMCDPLDGHLLLDGGYVNNLPGSLWRYVRASMTFAGPFPPLCDPRDGHLLVDGCYVDNVPADVMREMGAKMIFAIDVGSQDDIDLTNYGDTLNGWWLLWKKWNPWATPVKVPSLQEIQSRLAYVSCVKQLEQLKHSDYCIYVRPPIDRYKTLQFGSFDEIMEIGYLHGISVLPALKEGDKSLGDLFQKRDHHQNMHILTNASFTDLAEMVCKIHKPRRISVYSVSDDDDEFYDRSVNGYSSEPDQSLLDDTDKEDDGEECLSPALRRRQNIGSLSDIEYCAEREL